MSSLTNKVALITGASKGIGKAIATSLSSRGATVVINYSRDSAAADALVSTLTLAGGTAIAIKADVSVVEECKMLVAKTVEAFGKIDVLVLNAGAMSNADLEGTSEELFEKTFAVNVKGPFFIAQAATPHIPTTGSGRIIFFSTSLTAASTITPNYTLYLATKGSIEQLTRALSKDLGTRNITVNCISPGPTETEMFYNGKSPDLIRHIAALTPSKRIGKPEEVAEVVAFLAGGEARWVSGQNLRVNGGMA